MRILYFSILIILPLLNISCSNQKKKSNFKFNLEIELAKHQIGESIDAGEINFDQLRNRLDTYDWESQVRESNVLLRTAPTFSVNNNVKNQTLWITAQGDPLDVQFTIGTVLPLNNHSEERWVKIYALDDYERAKDYFELFFDEKIIELEVELFDLEFLMEMEEHKG